MKNIFFIPLIVLLFFACIVGAMNILNNTDNRPFRLVEFIETLNSVNFSPNYISNFFNDVSQSHVDKRLKEKFEFYRQHYPDCYIDDENRICTSDGVVLYDHYYFDEFLYEYTTWDFDFEDNSSLWANVESGLSQFGITIISLADIIVNTICGVFSFLRVFWHFCVGVPV